MRENPAGLAMSAVLPHLSPTVTKAQALAWSGSPGPVFDHKPAERSNLMGDINQTAAAIVAPWVWRLGAVCVVIGLVAIAGG